MADEIIIETTSQEVITVGVPGPQGPRGADGTGLETLTTKGDTLYRGETTGERLPIGTTGQILRVSSSGLPEWGAAPASGVSSVSGKTGAVLLDSTDVLTDQALQISDAGVADCNGVFVYGGLFNGRPTYYATKDTFVYWDGSNWVINHNGDDQYFGTATTYPWQAVWSLGDGANPLPVVTQAASHEFEQVVGQRTNPTARGDAASKNVGTGANDVAAGNHTHVAANVTDFNSAAAAAAPVQSVNGNTGAVTVSVPSASSTTPSALGVAAAGSSNDFARADHVHAMPSASDIGLGPDDTVTFGGIDVVSEESSIFITTVGIEFGGDTAATTRANLGLGTAAVADIGTGAGDVCAGDDARLSDSRTPSSHSASHASGGSDPLAPSDIGAQSLFANVSQIISADVTLTSGRATRLRIENYDGVTYNITLPTTSNQVGDVLIVTTGTLVGSQTIRRENFSGNFTTLATILSGQSYRFITTGTTSGSWQVDVISTHQHDSSDITSGTLDIARIPTGTSSTQVSLGNHTHGNISHDGKIGSTAGLPVVTTTAGAVTTLALGTANQILRVNSGATGVEFADPAASGVSSVSSSASDVLGVSGANITGVDAGSADRLVFWDDSANKLTYLEAGSGLSISGTTMTVTATGGATNLWIPASAWIPRTTGGCGVDSREIGATNRANVDELLFDTGTEEFAQALVVMPSNYNNSTLTARFYWTAASGSGGVAWGISGRAYGDDDALDQATGTRVVVTDTFITANDVHVTSATSAVTIDGTPAANKAINFQIVREVGNGSDTLAVDARLLGVQILFN